MNLWTVVLIASAGTLLLRVMLLVAARPLTLTPAVDRVAGLVLPVALAAILGSALHAAAVVAPAGLVSLLVAAAVTAAVARRTGSVLAAIGAGLAVSAAIAWLF